METDGVRSVALQELARIRAVVDGYFPGSNDMPGALTFWTTSDGKLQLIGRLIYPCGNDGTLPGS